MIIALSRKLLITLWRYVETGLSPANSGGLDCLDRGCRWLSGFSAGYVSPFLALHAGKA
jgi:hypothetical protein